MFNSPVADDVSISIARPEDLATGVLRSSRLSKPEPGRSLGATVTRIELPIRRAVQLLNVETHVDEVACAAIFDCTVYGPNATVESNRSRLVWFFVAVAIVNALAERRSSVSSFRESLVWFTNDPNLAGRLLSCFTGAVIASAEAELAALYVNDDLFELLPYVFEPHGHITRNSLQTCEIARSTRSIKKDAGVYYTPSDIAEFMVAGVASKTIVPGSWLDPACGTGVFLRAILRNLSTPGMLKKQNLLDAAISLVYGIDKSALATDLATFVMLMECSQFVTSDRTPFSVWRRLKANVVCMDALRLVPSLRRSELQLGDFNVQALDSVFPSIGASGFDHVVMNPPYSSVGIDSELRAAWHSFSEVQPGQRADVHLAFTEMLWRFTSERGVAAAVLPLSVAANTSRSYKNLREELIRSSGSKEFLFFDREPQSLFGEDIKTRNLIVFRSPALNGDSVVKTSRLLKWSGRQRPDIFTCDRLVGIDPAQCVVFVPKLGSDAEVATYRTVRSASFSASAVQRMPLCQRVALQDAVAMDEELAKRSVFVSSTAYNFVNAFFSAGLPKSPPKPYSSSPVNALIFSTPGDAFAGYSILTSRFCFWMWHVEGDGFHLTTEFLKRLPFWAALENKSSKSRLESLGGALWDVSAKSILGSVNGGKQTYSFHSGFEHSIAAEIELILLDVFRLNHHSTRCLDDFVDAVVSVDGTRRTRNFLVND